MKYVIVHTIWQSSHIRRQAMIIARFAACMAVLFIARSPNIIHSASAASFIVNQIGFCRFRSILPITRKTMSSSTGSPPPKVEDPSVSQQGGLSDIGQSTTNSNADNAGKNWKERIDISIAKSRKIRGSNYVQISTVDYETMEPRCRTVVFRGFLKDFPFGAAREVLLGGDDGVGDNTVGDLVDHQYDCVMKMITDMRSNKVKELEMFHESKSKGGGGKGNNINTAEVVWW